MNFNSIFEELSKLYENKPVKDVKEGCNKKVLKEETELSLEANLDQLLARSTKDKASRAVIQCSTTVPYEQVSDWVKTTGKKYFLIDATKPTDNLRIPSDTVILVIDKFDKASNETRADLSGFLDAIDESLTVLLSYGQLDSAIVSNADFVYTEPVNEALNEAADDEEIEFAEEPVDVIPGESEVEEAAEEDVNTVEEFLKSIGEYDGDLKLEFKPIVIDGKEYSINNILWSDEEEGKLVAEFVVDMPEEDEAVVEEEPVEDEPVDEE